MDMDAEKRLGKKGRQGRAWGILETGAQASTEDIPHSLAGGAMLCESYQGLRPDLG